MSEFTLHAELWAKENYGSLTSFYEKICGNEEKSLKPELETILETVLYLTTDEISLKVIESRCKAGESLLTTLAKNMNYKTLEIAAKGVFELIKESMSDEQLKKMGLEADQQRQNRKTRRAMQGKKRKRKAS